MVWRVSVPCPTRVQTWWDSVDIARNIMDSTIFRERLHGVIVPWLLWRNMEHEQGDRNNEYVPSSLFPCKWLCHKYDILLRWMPLFTHLHFQGWIHIFSFFSLLLLSSQSAQTSWQLRVTRALNRSSYILLPQIGTQSSRLDHIWGAYPLSPLWSVTWYRGWILIGYWYVYITEASKRAEVAVNHACHLCSCLEKKERESKRVRGRVEKTESQESEGTKKNAIGNKIKINGGMSWIDGEWRIQRKWKHKNAAIVNGKLGHEYLEPGRGNHAVMIQTKLFCSMHVWN